VLLGGMSEHLSFEWDDDKAVSNLRKHGILFEDARFVFSDPNRTTVPDVRFNYGEDRFVTYGFIDNRLFTVVFAQNFTLDVVRIISARKANFRERKRYGHREIHH
jgi:uncharacterized protein